MNEGPAMGSGGNAGAAPIMQAARVSKSYRGVAALSDVSINIYCGEIYGIAGLNGAGKSTLLSVLAGAAKPDSGKVLHRGADIRSSRRALRVGYVPQEIALFPDLTVRDNLKFWAAAASARPSKGQIAEAAEASGLSGALGRRVSALSGGMKRRANIASALVARPDVLIMDEPTAGLDAKNRRDIIGFIMRLAGAPRAEGGGAMTVVYTSHQAGELEYVSDRILLLHRGRAIFEGAPGDAARNLAGSLGWGGAAGVAEAGGATGAEGAAEAAMAAGQGCAPSQGCAPGQGSAAGPGETGWAKSIDDVLYILGGMEEGEQGAIAKK